jgi:hypothetical protein
VPKLPDVNSLGVLGTFRSDRPVSTFDTRAVGEGIAALGRGISEAGTSLNNVAERQKDAGQGLQEAQAEAYYRTNKIRLTDEIDSVTDPNDDTLAKFQDRHRETLDQAANVIQDPKRREKWRLSREPEVESTRVRASDKQFALKKDEALADTFTSMTDLQTAAASAKSEGDKVKAMQAGHDLIDKLEENGYYGAADAAKARKRWAEGYAIEVVNRLPPRERIAALHGGWEGTLVSRESGGNPGKVNQFGYAGLGQFGAPRLADIGVYTPGAKENLDSWSKTDKNAPGKWSGTFSIPGFENVRTINDFLENPDAQKAVFAAHTGKMDQEIAERGLDKYIGKSVGGVTITQAGLYNMMHLGGAGGTQRFLETGGQSNAQDANGTSLADYARMGAKQAPGSAIAKFIPGDQQEAIANGAKRELYAAGVDEERAARLDKHRAQLVSDQTENDLLKDIYSDNPQTTAQSIVGNDKLTREAKERMIGVVSRANKPDPMSRVSQQTSMELLDRIRKPEGDPERVTTVNPIYDAYIKGDLTRPDFEFIKKQFTEGTSENGSSLGKLKKAFTDQAKESIDLANMAGKMTGGAGTFARYEFERYVDKKVDDYRQASKDPANLFDPAHADYLGKADASGKPAVLRPFISDLQKKAREEAAATPPKASTVSPAASATERARLDEWLRARGGPTLPKPAALAPAVPMSR